MLFTAMGYEEVAALVFDNGGGMVKAGVAGDDALAQSFRQSWAVQRCQGLW